MEKMKCIRALADVEQIVGCKERVSDVKDKIHYLSNALCLAGNEVRLKIIFLLNEEKQLCVCDLSDILEMKVAAISQHLRKMKDGKIVQSNKTGQTIYYSLNSEYKKLLYPILKLITNKEKLEIT